MKKNILAAVFLMSVLFVGYVAQAGPGRTKMARDLATEVDRGAPASRIIVLYDREVGESKLDAIRGRGGVVHRKLDRIRAVSGTLTGRELARLAEDPQVVSISPDRVVRGSMDISVPTIGADHLTEVFGYVGQGVTVALKVLDDEGAGYLNAVAATAATGPYQPKYFNSSSPLVERFDDGTYRMFRLKSLSMKTRTRGNSAVWGESAIWGESILGNGD